MSALPAPRLVPVLTRTVEPVAQVPKHKVLLIHESLASRSALEKAMRGQFEVRIARDAEDGWQSMLTDQSIRAVVASLPVLEIDGYGLLQRIRGSKVSRISGAPIVVVSDEQDQSLGDLAASFGASGFTPFSDMDGLRDRLQALIEPGTVLQASKPSGVLKALSANLSPAPAQPTPVIPKPETEHSMSRLESLNKVLKTLQSSSPGVEASALISSDGLMIASALAKDMDETRIAAMTATLLNLGTRAATELRRGEVSEVIVRGDHGYAVMLSAGRGALLLVLATEDTPLGLIFFDMREAVKGIKTVL